MRPEDHLVWMTWWHADEAYFRQAAEFYVGLPVPLTQIWVLGNTVEETRAAQSAGFRSAWVNNNAWLDERLFQPRPMPAEYRAVMVCQLAPYKRVQLAAKVRGLVLLTSALFQAHTPLEIENFTDVRVLNTVPVKEVPALLNRCQTGLILSEEEGACFASSEYLLCGLPVVSTPSRGGRDVFFTPENSWLVEPTPEAVARGVDAVIARGSDPWAIHRTHVALSHMFRERFVHEVLGRIVTEQSLGLDPVRVFASIFKHKMIEYPTESVALDVVRA